MRITAVSPLRTQVAERECSHCNNFIYGDLDFFLKHMKSHGSKTLSGRKTRLRKSKALGGYVEKLERERAALRKANASLLKKIQYDTSGDSFYKTGPWLRLRYTTISAYKAKYGDRCLACNQTGKPLHVDHILPRSKYPDKALDPDNLQVLCSDCNLGKSNLDETDFRK